MLIGWKISDQKRIIAKPGVMVIVMVGSGMVVCEWG